MFGRSAHGAALMDAPAKPKIRTRKTEAGVATARCLCGKVVLEIRTPAVWAWHDHGPPSRRAHGAAYATYVGTWKSKFRVAKGASNIAHYLDKATGQTRGFCKSCGTPVTYERPRAPKMINIPRALFDGRTGREPRYHIAIADMADWAYAGARLVPLKGYPGVVWERPKAKKKRVEEV